MTALIDPVVLFFLLGVGARLARSDLRLPESLYETLSIYLLLAIGLKGGIELARGMPAGILPLAIAGILLSAAIPVFAFAALKGLGRMARPDAAAIAAHYGSVSVVTFAVAQSRILANGLDPEPAMALVMALMEAPGIVVGIVLARMQNIRSIRWGTLAHEVVFGKAVYLLLGGILIGAIIGPDGAKPIQPLFGDLFKGVLALFLLEMGLVAGGRLADLRRAGAFLVGFGLIAPLVFGAIGMLVATALQASVTATALFATLCASASYIAAPTAMRIAVPEANPALSIGVALGVTFPFNVTIGIPLYIAAAQWIR